MTTLPIPTLIGNAAAVLSHGYGAVTGRAKLLRCSRQTIYKHARLVQRALRQPAAPAVGLAPQERPRPIDPPTTRVTRADRRRFAIEACAAGCSTRQAEHLLRVLLGEGAPDHATIARWVAAAAGKARDVLAVLDRAAVASVETIAGDEIFLATGRRSSGSSRTA